VSRDHARLSASGLERAETCPAAYALPKGPDTDDDSAARGRVIHRFLERAALGEREAALEEVPSDLFGLCAAVDVRALAGFEPEVAFVYDVTDDTARCLGRIDHRAYGELLAGELPCTTDALARDPWLLSVVDYKTGFENQPAAATSFQLQTQALCAARVEGASEVGGAIVRVTEAGELVFDQVTFDAMDLDAIAARLLAVWQRVEEARASRRAGRALPVVQGRHCKWCPAKSHCPAWAADAAEIQHAGSWVEAARAELKDPAAAGRWYDRWQRGREILDAIGDLIKERAGQGAIPLPDGRVLKASQSSRTSLHAETLLDLLAEQVGGRGHALALATARGAVRTTTFPVLRPSPNKTTKTTTTKETSR